MPGGVYIHRSLLGGGGLKLVLVTEQLVKYGIADLFFPAHIYCGTSKPGKLGAWGPGCLIFVLCLVPQLQLHQSAVCLLGQRPKTTLLCILSLGTSM